MLRHPAAIVGETDWQGALDGLTVVELGAIGPVPFAGMMLADHGARVIRIERPGAAGPLRNPHYRDIHGRNREWRMLDMKDAAGLAELRGLLAGADALIEGFRPGVLERLGLAPQSLLAENPRLVIGRMTGWGQTGPLADRAGHDIDYIALSGALHTFGEQGGKPVVPTNLVGDYGGGGMLLAFGVLAGVLSARSTGQGQVVDCAMLDGAALLNSMIQSLFQSGMWHDERGTNLLDGAAPYYSTYETADGKWIALGAIEDPFYDDLLDRLGLAGDADFADRIDPANWPRQQQRIAEIIRRQTRAEWCVLLEPTDVCFAPVLSLGEAPLHPHNVARATFIETDGVTQPAPAPRLPPHLRRPFA